MEKKKPVVQPGASSRSEGKKIVFLGRTSPAQQLRFTAELKEAPLCDPACRSRREGSRRRGSA